MSRYYIISMEFEARYYNRSKQSSEFASEIAPPAFGQSTDLFCKGIKCVSNVYY